MGRWTVLHTNMVGQADLVFEKVRGASCDALTEDGVSIVQTWASILAVFRCDVWKSAVGAKCSAMPWHSVGIESARTSWNTCSTIFASLISIVAVTLPRTHIHTYSSSSRCILKPVRPHLPAILHTGRCEIISKPAIRTSSVAFSVVIHICKLSGRTQRYAGEVVPLPEQSPLNRTSRNASLSPIVSILSTWTVIHTFPHQRVSVVVRQSVAISHASVRTIISK